jgi:thymidine phosphorylase
VARLLERVGDAVGLIVRPVLTDGTQPIGRGIGPAYEARDVVAVTRGDLDAPADLRARALLLAGEVLELAGASPAGHGAAQAAAILTDGRAWRKLQAICEAQGGMRTPPVSAQRFEVTAPMAGTVLDIDNRRLSRAAKLAGAPADPAAGIDLHVRLGDRVAAGEPLFTLHAESPGEVGYVRDYLAAHADVISVGVPR